MITIKAIVRNGRIETDTPLDLPEGTELIVLCKEESPADELDDSPEGEKAWLDFHESLKPSAE